MKKILITGKGSYIGTSLIKWLENKPEDFHIEEISVRGEEWKSFDFSKFDTVFHVAGIAHVSTDPDMEEQYYKVNRDLTIEVAEKSKRDGVNQFIFMSSMIVYGDATSTNRIITKNTKPSPSNFYGQSKLEAEMGLNNLRDSSFNIAIIRPPMIYGKDSKGNYPRLSSFAQKSIVFPKIYNERSMLYIDNLMELIYLLVKNNDSGLFFPQNKEYVNTSKMVNTISKVHNKKLRLTKVFNPLIVPFINRIQILNKVFGNLKYDKSISEYKDKYQIFSFEESINKTER